MLQAYLKLTAMVILTSFSQILVKKGAVRIVTGQGLKVLAVSSANPGLVAGVLAAAAAPLLYISALTELPLSMAFSFNGLSYVLVLVLGHVILGEKLTKYHTAGVCFIVAGFFIWNSSGGM